MTNREKFREVFNKDIHWSRALEPQILALKSAHIDGIDCMEEWLNSEYIEPQVEEDNKKIMPWYLEPFKQAIETLDREVEQEPILDKIRAEIDNALSDGMIHKKTVLGIIDKYKAESEDNNADKEM